MEPNSGDAPADHLSSVHSLRIVRLGACGEEGGGEVDEDEAGERKA